MEPVIVVGIFFVIIVGLIAYCSKLNRELLETKLTLQNKENELHQQRLHNTIVKQFVQGHKQYTDADFIKYLKSYLRIK